MKEFNDAMICSVVIPSYNSKRTIMQCLESIKKMKTMHSYEVIVVDSSSDETPDLIRTHFPEFKLIHLEEQTYPGSARNLGFMEAKANIIAFVDSDCTVAEDWLEKMVEAHRQYEDAAIVGSVGNGTPKSIVGTTGYLVEFNEWTPKTKPRIINAILGGNVSYKKEIIQKHRLSYTDIFPSEDTIFAWDLNSKGETIRYDPTIVVYHLNRTELKILLRHQVVMGKSVAESRRITGLFGQTFIKYPWLSVGLPAVRFSRAGYRLFRQDFKTFLLFLLYSPLYFICVLLWVYGFASKSKFDETKIKYDHSNES